MKVRKKTIVRYFDPDGRRCKSSTPGAKKVVEHSPNYYGWVNGRSVALCPDKGESKNILAKLLSDVKLEEVGLADPYREHRHRPLLDHLADYLKYLTNKRRDDEYVKKTEENCRMVIEGCGFKTVGDIRESSVVKYLDTLLNAACNVTLDRETYTTKEVAALLERSVKHVLRLTNEGQLPSCGRAKGSGPRKLFHRDEIGSYLKKHKRGIGPVTANHLLAAIKRFAHWLVKDRRIDVDYLVHLDRFNEDEDLRHRRRAMEASLFMKFVETTIQGKPFRGLTGPDRHFLYILAAYTGLRAGELASLTPEDFHLDAKQPEVVIAAHISKHREEDRQPLPPDIVKIIRFFLRDKKPGQQIWPGSWSWCAAEMIRIDLAAAGIAYRDQSGRVFDFHALRGQFITGLVSMGSEPKSTQKLARHKNITLTIDLYTDAEMVRAADELKKLPRMKSPLVEAEEKENAA